MMIMSVGREEHAAESPNCRWSAGRRQAVCNARPDHAAAVAAVWEGSALDGHSWLHPGASGTLQTALSLAYAVSTSFAPNAYLSWPV